MSKPELKYVGYYRAGYNGFVSQVAYVILGDACIYTAHNKGGKSTINGAESIAFNICTQEMRLLNSLRWFDLQTESRYPGLNVLAPPTPGDFEFDEVTFNARGGATTWITTICPQHVIDLFRDRYIPGEPKQVFNRPREEAQQVRIAQY